MQLLLQQSAADSSAAGSGSPTSNISGNVHARTESPANQRSEPAPKKKKKKKVSPESKPPLNRGSVPVRPPMPDSARSPGTVSRAGGYEAAGAPGAVGGRSPGSNGGAGGSSQDASSGSRMAGTRDAAPPPGLVATPTLATAAAASAPGGDDSALKGEGFGYYNGVREYPVTEVVTAVAWRDRESQTRGLAHIPPPAEWRKQQEAYQAAGGSPEAGTDAHSRRFSELLAEKGAAGADGVPHDGGAYLSPPASATTAAGSAAAHAAASAAAGQSRLNERFKREEQQRLHSAGLQQKRTLQQAEQQKQKQALGQAQYQRQEHDKPSKVVLPPLAGRHAVAAATTAPATAVPPTANLHALHTAASMVGGGASNGGSSSGPSASQASDASKRRSHSSSPYLDQHQQHHYQRLSPPVGPPHHSQNPDVTYIHLPSAPGGAIGAGGQRSAAPAPESPARAAPRGSAELNADPAVAGSGLGRGDGVGNNSRTPSPRTLASAAGAGVRRIVESSMGGGGGGGRGGSHEGPHPGGGAGSAYAPWASSSQASARRGSPSPWSSAQGYGGMAAEGGIHNATGRPPPDGPPPGFGGGGSGGQSSSSRYEAIPSATASGGVTVPGYGAIAAGAGLQVHRPHLSGSQVRFRGVVTRVWLEYHSTGRFYRLSCFCYPLRECLLGRHGPHCTRGLSTGRVLRGACRACGNGPCRFRVS